MASSSCSSAPCAACKFLRRKCLSNCIFAPYFPPEEPQKFANVHKIFGASNVSKLLNEILPHQREDAVNSLAYEAEARMKDPVYGCVGAISLLQRQVVRLQKELEATNADLMRYTSNDQLMPPHAALPLPLPGHNVSNTMLIRQRSPNLGRRLTHHNSSGSSFDHNSGLPIPYSYPWNYNPNSSGSPEGGRDHGSV